MKTLFFILFDKDKCIIITTGKFFLCLLFLVLLSSSVYSQDNPESTTEGTEFWVTFGQCDWVYNPDGYTALDYASVIPYYQYSPAYLGVKIAASEETVVNYEFMDNSNLNTSFTISAGTMGLASRFGSAEKQAVYLVRPYVNAASIPAYNNKSTKVLRITTDKPVSVYAVNNNSGSGDATNILPVDNWGTSYYHISNPSDISGSNGGDNKFTYMVSHYDGYALIANQNGTIIYENGTQISTLNRGEVYCSYSAGGGNYTGRNITSNYPVAYFVINTGTRVPTTSASTENLFQQLVPVNGWGRDFIVPVTHRGTERVKIMSSQAGTNVTVQGSYSVKSGNLSNLGKGSAAEIEITSACYIQSNYPIGVCSYLVGSYYIGETNSFTAGDPSMAWIPAVEQFVYSTTISAFPMTGVTQGTLSHYAVIIVPVGSESRVTVAEGTNPPAALSGGTWTNTNYGYSSYDMPVNSDLIYTFTNPQGLMVLGYGYGGSASYYYVAGAAARDLNPYILVDEEHFQDIQDKGFCNDNIDIKAVIYSQISSTNYLTWYVDDNRISSLNDHGQWNVTSLGLTSGKHAIRMEVINLNGDTDRCTYNFSIDPLLITEGDTSICLGETVQLSGNYADGVWSSSDNNIVSVSSTGLVKAGNIADTAYIIYANENCTDSIRVIVKNCSRLFEVWNWEDLWEAIGLVNAGSIDTISLMQHIGIDNTNSGNGIGTGPNGEDCPHTENEKKTGSFGYDDTAYGFYDPFESMGENAGWSCPAITADSFLFEGNGNAINGLYYDGSDYETSPALFSTVNKAKFKNLTLTTSDMGLDFHYGADYMGGFIARALAEISFDNCTFKGYIVANFANEAGGFVGRAQKHVTITNSYVADSMIFNMGNTDGIGGFVGNALDGVTIDNSTSNMEIKAGAYVGGFVGSSNNDIKITNSTSNAVISNITNWIPGGFVGSQDGYSEDYVGGRIGGFVGTVYTDWGTSNSTGTTIAGCSMNGQLISNDQTHKLNVEDYKNYVGGIIGYIGYKDATSATGSNAAVLIDKCSVTGTMNTPESYYAGGFIGGVDSVANMGDVSVSASYVACNIIAKRKAGGFVGVISGDGNVHISETYYRGSISAGSSGGFAAILNQTSGSDNLLEIENCYVAGSVFGNDVAGFVYNVNGRLSIQNSFQAMNLTHPGDVYAGKGILFGDVSDEITIQNVLYDKALAKNVGEVIANTGAITGQVQAFPNVEMTLKITYPQAWFDNAGVWAMVDKETYPYLKWQVTTDLVNPENSYAFGTTQYQLENTTDWIEYNRIAVLPSNGNYTFSFKSGEGNNAAEAFFPYETQTITFSAAGNTLMLNGFNAMDSIVAFGVSQSGIIGVVYQIICPSGNRLYVNQNIDQADEGDGSSWEMPLMELADALQIAGVCSNITEIWVAEGTYLPKYDLLGNEAPGDTRDATFRMVSGVGVYGGFPADATTADNNDKDNILHRNWNTWKTTLSGDLDALAGNSGNAYHVLSGIGLNDTTEFNGFIITGGNANGNGFVQEGVHGVDRNSGGGIVNYLNLASTTSSLYVKNTIITGNNAEYGGGIYIDRYANPYFVNVLINNNIATYGGGVYRDGASSSRMAVSGANPTFTNVTIADNSNYGIYKASGSVEVYVYNSIIWGNEYGVNTSAIVYDNSSIVQGVGAVPDPAFQDPDNNDYSLAVNSPAIDAGDNNYYFATIGGTIDPEEKDLAAWKRIHNTTIDIGAYEWGQNYHTLRGTVFPFIHEGDSGFDTLFKVTASLYAVPPVNSPDPVDEILNDSPLYYTNAINYDGSIFVAGTPKYPGHISSADNPGLPISWEKIGKIQGKVNDTLLVENERPQQPIGLYQFNDIPVGDYILMLSRPGFISRFAKITVSMDGVLGHRELIGGDVNGDLEINAHDISSLHSKFATYGESGYRAKYDLDGNRKIDDTDIAIIIFFMSGNMGLYKDTELWLLEY